MRTVAQDLLSDEEIHECIEALKTSFAAIQQIRETIRGGHHVQLPKLPSILSESLVAREIRHQRGPFWPTPVVVARGGRDADLVVLNGSVRELVEVKATGRQGFQYFSPKDVATDVLVWIAFGGALEAGKLDAVPAHWVQKPSRFWAGATKISLPGFLRAGGKAIATTTLRLA